MSHYTLPLEPYLTKAMEHYRVDPTFEPLKFYTMLKDEHGAYVSYGTSYAYDEPYFFFYTEQEKLLFLMRFS